MNNNIINEILNKMSKIETFFDINNNNDENSMQHLNQHKLIDTDFISNTFLTNNPAPIGKRSSTCNLSTYKESRSSLPDRKKLFVGNLPSKTTLAELLQVFKVFGPINENLSVVKEDNYAFIHFYNEKDAEQAYKSMNDSFFKNRYIRVQYSTSQGHMKKSKTFETNNRLTESTSCFALNRPQLFQPIDHYSSFASINESNEFNRLINSQSFATFNDSSLFSSQMRPITRRSVTKSSFNDINENHLSSSSLLMPVNNQLIHSNNSNNNYDMFFGSTRFNDFSLFGSLSNDKENQPFSAQPLNSNPALRDSTDSYVNNLQ